MVIDEIKTVSKASAIQFLNEHDGVAKVQDLGRVLAVWSEAVNMTEPGGEMLVRDDILANNDGSFLVKDLLDLLQY